MKLSVNELSKITGVTTRNIRYYNSIDLFKPSGYLDNGYRYYHLEKIEELRFITYLRHAGIKIKEIKWYLDNRDINAYEGMLSNHLEKIDADIKDLLYTKERLHKRLNRIDLVKAIPAFDTISIRTVSRVPILVVDQQVDEVINWEQALLNFEESLPPSLIIGDVGFFLDYENRKSNNEFISMYLLADDPYLMEKHEGDYLQAGKYLCMYIKGGHEEAATHYEKMLDYAKVRQINLSQVASERVLSNHILSSDQACHITEIMIRIEE